MQWALSCVIKSAISVGLLYIPVGMYKTTRNASISFNQLCKDSKERIRYKKYCPSCDKEIKNEDIIKGYEYEKPANKKSSVFLKK